MNDTRERGPVETFARAAVRSHWFWHGAAVGAIIGWFGWGWVLRRCSR